MFKVRSEHPPPPATEWAGLFQFAEIPEIVFVEGIAENEEMGIYFLDPTNRTRPGDHGMMPSLNGRIKVHDDLGTYDYSPTSGLNISLVSVSGTQPPGVSYESSTGRIKYASDAQTDPKASWTVRFSAVVNGEQVLSNPFKVRVMRPDAVFGIGAAAFNSAKGWGAAVCDPSTGGVWDVEIKNALVQVGYENVVFVVGGFYDETYAGSNFSNHYSGDEIYYLLGEPYNKPWWHTRVRKDTFSVVDCIFAYVKNFKFTDCNISISPENAQVLASPGVKRHIMNVELVDWAEVDRNGFGVSDYGGSQAVYCVGPFTMFVINLFSRRGGGTSTTHTMYIHGRPNARLIINNARIYGGRSQSQIKTVMQENYILNSIIHCMNVAAAESDGNHPQFTEADRTDMWRCSKMVDIATMSDGIIYNCDFVQGYTTQVGINRYDSATPDQIGGPQEGSIFVQERHYQFFGGDEPSGPDVSFLRYTKLGLPLDTPLRTGCGFGVPEVKKTVTSLVTAGSNTVSLSNVSGLLAGQSVSITGLGNVVHYSTIQSVVGLVVTLTTPFAVTISDPVFSVFSVNTSTWSGDIYPLSPPSEHLNGWPNRAETYLDPDFWNAIRTWNGAATVDDAIKDPTNPYTWKRYISYCRFRWVTEDNSVRCPWIRDDGQLLGGNYVSTFDYVGYIMPTTANWTHRSANFVANCKWTGWTDADVDYRDVDNRGARWQDIEKDKYLDEGLEKADSVRVGPFGQTITVNGKQVFLDYTPVAERVRPRPIVHVGGSTGPTSVTDPGGHIALPWWFRYGPHKPTLMESVAQSTVSGQWSEVMSVPTVNQRTLRLDEYNVIGTDYPSSVGGTTLDPNAVPLVGRLGTETRAWIWGSRFVWDSVNRRALAIYAPHLWDENDPAEGRPPMGDEVLGKWTNPHTTLLGFYSEKTNTFRAYEAPLIYNFPADGSGFSSHMFDNNCIRGRTLYKWTQPVWTDKFTPGVPAGYVQPQVIGIDLDAIVDDDPASVVNGAAFVESLGRPSAEDITAPSLDYHQGIDKLVLQHKNRIWFYSFATSSWSPPITLTWFVRDDVYHNLGNYNPNSGWHVCGGGSAVHGVAPNETFDRQYDWAGVSPSGDVVQLDQSPVCLSLSDSAGWPFVVKACGTHSPNSDEHIFFHDNGNIYGLDPQRTPGTQWRVVGTIPSAVQPTDWCCSIPEYGAILVGSYGGYGTNRLRLYKV